MLEDICELRKSVIDGEFSLFQSLYSKLDLNEGEKSNLLYSAFNDSGAEYPEGKLKIAESLLKQGLNVIKNLPDIMKDMYSGTYLHINSLPKKILLLKNYTNPNQPLVDDDGNNPLHFLIKNYNNQDTRSYDIAFSGIQEILKIQQNQGITLCDINAKNAQGQSPLHLAVRMGREGLECIQLLIQCGADTTLENNQSQTPFDLAYFDETKYFLLKDILINDKKVDDEVLNKFVQTNLNSFVEYTTKDLKSLKEFKNPKTYQKDWVWMKKAVECLKDYPEYQDLVQEMFQLGSLQNFSLATLLDNPAVVEAHHTKGELPPLFAQLLGVEKQNTAVDDIPT